MANLAAHITGTVVKIEKKPGDEVQPGEPVVILESMKMEMPLEAEAAGRGVTVLDGRLVEALHVEEAKRILSLFAVISAPS